MKTIVFSAILLFIASVIYSQDKNKYEIDLDNCQIIELTLSGINSQENANFLSSIIDKNPQVFFCYTDEIGKSFIIAEKETDLSAIFNEFLSRKYDIKDQVDYAYNSEDLLAIYPRYDANNEYHLPSGFPKLFQIGKSKSYGFFYEEARSLWIKTNSDEYKQYQDYKQARRAEILSNE